MDAKMFSGLIRVGIETHVVQILFFQGCRESCGDAKTYKYLEGQRGGGGLAMAIPWQRCQG